MLPKESKGAKIEYKKVSPVHIDIKAITEAGSFEGLLSPFGNVDDGGDVVEPGAYTKNIKENGTKRPLLWGHDPKNPIGEIEVEERPQGLWCKGQLEMEDPAAKKAYLYMKKKIVRGLSIGFESVKDTIESGVRHLQEVKLYEGSVVLFPMNMAAVIANVKSKLDQKGDFNEELEERQLYAAFYQMQYALGDALVSCVYSDMTRDEKISTCNTILQQFSEAFTTFFPDYLDLMSETYGETWSKGGLEKKAGAMISAANKDTIEKACGMIMQGHDMMKALLENDKAGATTLETKAASPEPEPGASHSAADDLSEAAKKIAELRALFPA